MAQRIKQIKIFLASPSGLDSLRGLVRAEIKEYSATEGEKRGVTFKAVCWEDIYKGMGNPQEQINLHLYGCDYYILILHDRWGTPPNVSSRYGSGSEEEFHLAYTCYENKEYPMQDMIILFKEISDDAQSHDIDKINSFKKRLIEARKLMFNQFKNKKELLKILRTCLSEWLDKNVEEYCPPRYESPKTVLDFFSSNQ